MFGQRDAELAGGLEVRRLRHAVSASTASPAAFTAASAPTVNPSTAHARRADAALERADPGAGARPYAALRDRSTAAACAGAA